MPNDLLDLIKPVSERFGGGGFAMGSDIIPAMLTPGEFIMSRGAVNMFGARHHDGNEQDGWWNQPS